MEDILSSMLRHQRLLSSQLKKLFEHVEIMRLGVSHPQLVNCDICEGKHFNDSCHLYSMENYWWEQEIHPYNQYDEERTSNLDDVFREFMAYHASYKASENPMQNQEIQVGKSYSMENCQWKQELHPYNQYEKEKLLIWMMCLCNSWNTMLSL